MPDPLSPTPASPSPAPGTQPAPTPPAGSGGGAPPVPSTPSPAARPDWLDEGYWDGAGVKLDALKPVLDEHKALTTAQAERAAAVPKEAAGYKLELPAGVLPEGAAFQFDEQSPLLQSARAMAHEMGLPQAEFSRLLGLYAQDRIAEETHLAQEIEAQKGKLGTNANARIDAVHTFLSKLGPEKAGALKNMMFSAVQVEAFEDLMRMASGQGGAPMPGGGRDVPAKTSEPTDDEWARMSPARQIEFTRAARSGAGQR